MEEPEEGYGWSSSLKWGWKLYIGSTHNLSTGLPRLSGVGNLPAGLWFDLVSPAQVGLETWLFRHRGASGQSSPLKWGWKHERCPWGHEGVWSSPLRWGWKEDGLTALDEVSPA